MEPAGTQGATTDAGVDDRVVGRTREVPDVSFRAFLAAGDPPWIHWSTPGGLEIVGRGAAAVLAATGTDRFETIESAASTLFEGADHAGPMVARPRMHGGFSFFPDRETGAAQTDDATGWRGFPGARFVLPEATLVRADGTTYLTVAAAGADRSAPGVDDRLDAVASTVSDLPSMRPSGDPPGVAATRHTTSESAWKDQVERAVSRIDAGEVRKVVLATALAADLEESVDVPALLERLRRTYPDCYRFLVRPADGPAFFGASPERLVSLRGRSVRTEALAGSVPRGTTPEEDADLADSLRESEKLRREQSMVVRAVRERLEPLADVDVGDRTVRKLATIQHLRTPVRADLRTDRHVLQVAAALHPTPAVGGVPTDDALAAIRDVETLERGWYAAPVGWFDAAGEGEFAVGIRSAVARDDRAVLFGGNGIVADSDPAEEWAEVQLKYRPILDELE